MNIIEEIRINCNSRVETGEGVYDEFEREFDSVNCLELLGYDLNDEEEMRAAREQNVFEEKCLKYVLKAVKIIESKFL